MRNNIDLTEIYFVQHFSNLRIETLSTPLTLSFTPKHLKWITDATSVPWYMHNEIVEVIVAISGTFTLHVLTPTFQTEHYRMRNQAAGILIPPGHYIRMSDFSNGAVVLIMMSDTPRAGETDTLGRPNGV
jgi:hypothetical protein